MIGYHLLNALRGIRRSPGTTIVIVLSIALGIAVTTTMIAFYSGMSVEPIPHKSALVKRVLLDNWAAEKPFAEPNLAPPALTLGDARNLAASALPLRYAAHYHGKSYVTLESDGIKQRLTAATRAATRGFFEMFEPEFRYGSAWDANADSSREQVVVISAAVNERLFGGENSVGRELEVNGLPFRVVGVLASWDVFPLFYDMTREDLISDDIFLPLNVAIDTLKLWPSFSASPTVSTGADFDSRFLSGEAVFVQYWVEFRDETAAVAYQGFLTGYQSEQRGLGRFPRTAPPELIDVKHWVDRQQEGGNQRVFMQTLVAISLLFFGVCLLNIVTLLVARFMGNANTVSVLRALGIPRSAIFLEHLLEAAIMGICGGLLGLAFARIGVGLLGPLFLGADEGGTGAGIASGSTDFSALLDSGILLSSIGLAIAGALVVSLYPILKLCQVRPAQYLKSL